MYKTMKKIIAIILIVLFVAINIPARYQLKDGGTVVYKSVLWSYEKVHRMNDGGGYDVGTRLDILGIQLIDDVYPENPKIVC